jgi:hypothetical protein
VEDAIYKSADWVETRNGSLVANVKDFGTKNRLINQLQIAMSH